MIIEVKNSVGKKYPIQISRWGLPIQIRQKREIGECGRIGKLENLKLEMERHKIDVKIGPIHSKKGDTFIIQVYMLTSSHNNEEIEEIYEQILEVTSGISRGEGQFNYTSGY